MADASYFPYQTGVPVKLINLGPDATNSSDKYAFAMALSASGAAQGVYQVSVTPTVTAGTYAAGIVMGGVMTFANVVSSNYGYGGILESIAIKFKDSVQTAALNVAIFTQPPTGTFTNGNQALIAPADSEFLLGVYQLTTASSVLGTSTVGQRHTIYNLDGIAKALVGSNVTTPVNYAGNLYVVVVPSALTAALGSTSDMIVTLGILGG